jgi:penicillin-binding protein 1A
VGFTPYYTTAIWFGFDKPGNSLGLSITGATLAGPVWGDYMREIHTGLPMKDFIRPSGLADILVCSQSGLLKTGACPSGVALTFLAGTQPTTYCDMHGSGARRQGPSIASAGARRLDTLAINETTLLGDLKLPELPIDLLQSLGVDVSAPTNNRNTSNRGNTAASGLDDNGLNALPEASAGGGTSFPEYGLELPNYNPLLD